MGDDDTPRKPSPMNFEYRKAYEISYVQHIPFSLNTYLPLQ